MNRKKEPSRLAQMSQELHDAYKLIAKQGELLTNTVNLIRGMPPQGVLWSHHDVPQLVLELRDYVDGQHQKMELPMDQAVSFEGVDPARLLVALVNGTPPRGRGILAAAETGTFDLARARTALATHLDANHVATFDYVAGRPIKVTLDCRAYLAYRTWLYDRDAGDGAFARALAEARRGR